MTAMDQNLIGYLLNALEPDEKRQSGKAQDGPARRYNRAEHTAISVAKTSKGAIG